MPETTSPKVELTCLQGLLLRVHQGLDEVVVGDRMP